MTFEEFQATGREVVDLDAAGVAPDITNPGRVYEGNVYIEYSPKIGYFLQISNQGWKESDEGLGLEGLERILYDWAVDEEVLS